MAASRSSTAAELRCGGACMARRIVTGDPARGSGMAATSETQLFQGQLLDALAPCSRNSFQAPRQVVWHLNDQVRHLRPLPLLIVPHTREEAKATFRS